MKGQLFVTDLMSSFFIFSFFLLFLISIATSLVIVDLDNNKELERVRELAYGLDYLTYSDNLTLRPYVLKKAPTDAFFSMDNDTVAHFLSLERNFTLELKYKNGTLIHRSGETRNRPRERVVIERRVVYDGFDATIFIGEWKDR